MFPPSPQIEAGWTVNIPTVFANIEYSMHISSVRYEAAAGYGETSSLTFLVLSCVRTNMKCLRPTQWTLYYYTCYYMYSSSICHHFPPGSELRGWVDCLGWSRTSSSSTTSHSELRLACVVDLLSYRQQFHIYTPPLPQSSDNRAVVCWVDCLSPYSVSFWRI